MNPPTAAAAPEITLVTVADREFADRVRSRLTNWSQVGLIHADVWVLCGSKSSLNCQPAGFFDQNHGAVDSKLDVALAAREYGAYRIVNLVPMTDSTEDQELADAMTFLHDIIGEVDKFGAKTAKASVVNILLPFSTGLSFGTAPVTASAKVNLLAVPEDRKGPRFAQVRLGTPEDTEAWSDRMAAWGSAMVAVSAAIWNGMTTGPFDHMAVGTARDAVPVRSVRTFVRPIDGGFLIDHIGAGLVGEFDTWPLPTDLQDAVDLTEVRPQGIPDLASAFVGVGDKWVSPPDRTVSVPAASGIDAGALRCGLVIPPTPPSAKPLGVLAALKMMFLFLAKAIRRLPADIVNGFVESTKWKVASATQDFVFGNDSQYVVEFGGVRALPDGSGMVLVASTSEIERVLGELQNRLGRRSTPEAQPEVWKGLRALLFGLADGNRLPDVIDEDLYHDGARRLVVRNSDDLAPDPNGVPLILPPGVFGSGGALDGTDLKIGSCDPLGCRQLAAALRARIAHLEGTQAAAGPGPGAPPPPTPPSLVPPSADPDDEADTGAEDPAETQAPPSAPDPLRVHRQALAALRDWVSGRSGSLMWQVGDRLADEVCRSFAEFANAVDRLRRKVYDAKRDEQRARRRFMTFWLISVVVAVLAVLAGSRLLDLGLAVVIPVVVVLWLIATFFGWYRFQKQMFKIQHRAVREKMERQHAEYNVHHLVTEMPRLLARYSEFKDWSSLLGAFSHRPWGRTEQATALVADLDLQGLPRAIGSARGFVTPEKLQFLRAQCLHDIFHRGWLTDLFAPVRTEAINSVALENGLTDPNAVPAPEVDVTSSRRGTRQTLHRVCLDGSYGKVAAAAFRETVEAFCRTLAPNDLYAYIEVDPRPGDRRLDVEAAPQQWREPSLHLPPVSSGGVGSQVDVKAVVERVLRSVVHVHVALEGGHGTGSGVIFHGDGLIITNAHVVAGAKDLLVEFADGSASPAEIVGTRPDRDLAVLRVKQCSGPPVEVGAAITGLAVGDGVVAIGNPKGLRGGPSVSLGIVSALGRQETFDGGTMLSHLIQTDAATNPGSSGGGLFTGDGKCVGITTGGIADANNIGFAIPIEHAVEVARALGAAWDAGEANEVADLAAPALGDEATQSAEPVHGVSYPNTDEYFSELAPVPSDEFGKGLWRPMAGQTTLQAPSRVSLWHPPRSWRPEPQDGLTSDVIVPNVAFGKKLTYLAIDLDMATAGSPRDLLMFEGVDVKEPDDPPIPEPEIGPEDDEGI